MRKRNYWTDETVARTGRGRLSAKFEVRQLARVCAMSVARCLTAVLGWFFFAWRKSLSTTVFRLLSRLVCTWRSSTSCLRSLRSPNEVLQFYYFSHNVLNEQFCVSNTFAKFKPHSSWSAGLNSDATVVCWRQLLLLLSRWIRINPSWI